MDSHFDENEDWTQQLKLPNILTKDKLMENYNIPFTSDTWKIHPTNQISFNNNIIELNNWNLVEQHFHPINTPSQLMSSATEVQPANLNFNLLRDFFLRLPDYRIKKTFENTTQYTRKAWIDGTIHMTHKAPFPSLNVLRRNEPVAT